MRDVSYPIGGRFAENEVGSEENAGLINVPVDQIPSAIANAPHPSQTQTHAVKINGREEQWTTQQLIDRAQKEQAADEKFQQASQKEKEIATAINLQEDLEMIFKEGDIDAFRRLGAKMGVPGDQVESIAAKTFGDQTGEDDDEDVVDSYDREVRQGTRSREENQGPVNYDRLSPDIQRALRTVESARIGDIVKNALDNDKDLSYNIEQYDAKGRSAIRDLVDEKIRGRLASYGGDFGDGNRILAEVLPEIREHLQALGKPGSRSPLGLGHAPGGGDTEVYPRQKPDHVSSVEGDAFEQNILETMAYHQAQAERGRS